MPETEHKRLIHSAKDSAASGFAALVQRVMQDTERNIVESMASVRSGEEQSALNTVRHFLRQDGALFQRRIDALFRAYLERAMQTMFVDLRQDLRKLSIDELSLIDDEAVNRQIEVGRLTERMREANEECIGRLNVIVARLHGNHEARERENPFRPYLLARSLYEAIRETAPAERESSVLFDHLATALIRNLPEYYESIREVFESSGVRGEFQAQRSRAAHNQRYFGAPQADASQIGASVLPGLQRVIESLHGVSAGFSGAVPVSGDAEQKATVHEVLRKMLSSSRPFGALPAGGRHGVPSAVSTTSPLVAQLSHYQKLAAGGWADKSTPPASTRLSAMREQLNLDGASMAERVTVDVVALLLEFILEDPQIPDELRQQIARLQVPFLKAAVLHPDLLHEEAHPARQLLNRIGTVAASGDPTTPAGQVLAGEIARIIGKVLAGFDTDTEVFSAGLQEFETFLANHLQRQDDSIAPAIEAVEAAEKMSVLLTNTTNALCDVMLPLNIDKRISDFIIHVWPQVLVRASTQDANDNLTAGATASLCQQYGEVLPFLVWSLQDGKDTQERAALIRFLPELVKRLRSALQLIQLPDVECRQILDYLVELHTAILRAAPSGDAKAQPSFDELRLQFSRVAVRWDSDSSVLSEPPQPCAAVVEEAFAKRHIVAQMNLGVRNAAVSTADRDFLVQTYPLGTRVELCEGDSRVPAQLVWISTHRSLYLFRQGGDAKLVLYTHASLLRSLREESVVPFEYAPVFDRAVEALLFDAERLPAQAI